MNYTDEKREAECGEAVKQGYTDALEHQIANLRELSRTIATKCEALCGESFPACDTEKAREPQNFVENVIKELQQIDATMVDALRSLNKM